MRKNTFLNFFIISLSLLFCLNLISCKKNNKNTYYNLANSIEDSNFDFSSPSQVNLMFSPVSSYIYSFWDEKQCKKIISMVNGIEFTYTCQSSDLYEKYGFPIADPITISVGYNKNDTKCYYNYGFYLYQDGTLCFSFDTKTFYCSKKGCINFNNYVKLIEKIDAENRKNYLK